VTGVIRVSNLTKIVAPILRTSSVLGKIMSVTVRGIFQGLSLLITGLLLPAGITLATGFDIFNLFIMLSAASLFSVGFASISIAVVAVFLN